MGVTVPGDHCLQHHTETDVWMDEMVQEVQLEGREASIPVTRGCLSALTTIRTLSVKVLEACESQVWMEPMISTDA